MFFYYFIDDKVTSAAVVNPNQVYTYEEMEKDIIALQQAYPDLITYKVIGSSEYGRKIYAVSLGKGKSSIFINGSHHAREWLTTSLNMYMIDQYAQAYQNGNKISGYDVKSTLNNTTIWFVPMVNPDGVTLQQYGLKAFPTSVHKDLIKMNDGSTDFKRWKANAKGVDLNRQYAADWADIRFDPGKPYYKNYKGSQPSSAAEVKAILNFVSEIDPEATIAYHSSGEILFWNFHQTGSWYTRDHAYAKQIGNMTGYSLVYPGANPSGGGFTDWFIIAYKRPGFTPEIARYVVETSPPVSEFGRVWTQNKGVGLYVANIGHNLYQGRLDQIIEDATKKTRYAIAQSERLRAHYSSFIVDKEDLQVRAGFTKAYQDANKHIAEAEKKISTLPESNKTRLQSRLQDAYTHKNRAVVFIDSIKIGNQLIHSVNGLDRMIKNGQLNEETVAQYHQFSSKIKKTEIIINRLHGPHVRELAAEKYVLPAKILKETIIYEVSRYMLMKEIRGLLSQNNNVDLINAKLEELQRLEDRSIAIKAAGNKLHPGKYLQLPESEKILFNMKEALISDFTKINEATEKGSDPY
jgi:hypothetical protein